MFGKATLEIPRSDNGTLKVCGLSDELAMCYGRVIGRTLSEQDGYVVVTLESGLVKVIGYDTLFDRLTIGRLVPNYRNTKKEN